MRAMKKGPACQIEVASQYTKRFPDHATGWMVLADGLSVTARYGEAQVALRRAARLLSPDHRWQIAIEWGHFYRAKHDLHRAEQWHRKAVRLHPETRTHIFLGAALASQGRLAEAKKHHRRAIQLARDPRNDSPEEAYYHLGLILRAERRYREAAISLKRAIRLDPRYKIAREALKDVEQAIRFRDAG